jgi:hypothetical protein
MSEVRTRDFSRKVSALAFTAEGDHFDATPGVPPSTLQELIQISKADLQDNIEGILAFYEVVLLPESYVRFAERFHSKTNPIDVFQCIEIMTWLLEQYTARPTTPSVGSSASSQTETDTTGTSSTDGAPNEESNPSS